MGRADLRRRCGGNPRARPPARRDAQSIDDELVGPARLREIEPHAAGIEAVHVPEAKVLDYAAVCRSLASDLEREGHRVLRGARVFAWARIGSELVVRTSALSCAVISMT